MAAPSLPLISVALCTYNGEKYLSRQLETLVGQTYPNMEIIAVDDCSTDGTRSILGAYQAKYAFVKVYTNEHNLGYVKNFERAIGLCTGDFIALSDQDDIWMCSKLQILSEQIGDHILIYHDSLFVDPHENSIKDKKLSDHYHMYDGKSNLPFLTENCIAGHTMLFRKELVRHLFPFNRNFYHDWRIAFMACTLGKIKYLPEVLVKYRQHDFSITDSLSLREERMKEGREQKYLVYDLDWIAYCKTFYNPVNAGEVAHILERLTQYSLGKRGWDCFWFFVNYYDVLFYKKDPPKSYLSRLNFIRKIAF